MIPILVTRPAPDAEDTAARLAAIGYKPLVHPLLSFKPLDTPLPPAETLDGMILTSANAVTALEQRKALSDFRHLPVYAVGDRTARVAAEAGFAEVVSAHGDAGALVDKIAGQGVAGRLFYPSGVLVSHNLEAALAPHGIEVETVPVYAMQETGSLSEECAAKLTGGAIKAASFYSRRTAEVFVRLADQIPERAWRRDFQVMCLSENVAQPLMAATFARIALSDFPSEEGMMALALSHARGQN